MTKLIRKRGAASPAGQAAAPEAGRIGENTAQRTRRLVGTAQRPPIIDAAKVEIDAHCTDLQRLVHFSSDPFAKSFRGMGQCEMRVIIDNSTRCIVAYEVLPLDSHDL